MKASTEIAAGLNEINAGQLLDTLPDAWADKLRPEVVKLLSAGGDDGMKAVEALIRAKVAEWSLIESQPTYRWDAELGAVPVL
jgi:hypothetical protein